MRRMEAHWRVLLAHLVLFGFIYPGELARIPTWVMDRLMHRLRATFDACGMTLPRAA